MGCARQRFGANLAPRQFTTTTVAQASLTRVEEHGPGRAPNAAIHSNVRGEFGRFVGKCRGELSRQQRDTGTHTEQYLLRMAQAVTHAIRQ